MSREDPRLGLRKRRRMRLVIAGRPADCPYCGDAVDFTQPWDLDEIVPRAHGGDPLDIGNVRASHASCNRSAGARMKKAFVTMPLDRDDW